MAEIVRFPIEGMLCTSCVSRITRALRRLEGVESVKVDLGSDSATVAFDPARTSLVTIGAAVGRAGYSATIEGAVPLTPTERRGGTAVAGVSPRGGRPPGN